MNSNAKNFRKKYSVESIETEEKEFNPNKAAQEIMDEQLLEFASLVKGTPNEELIAFKDPKVQELVDFVMAAIILENERINAPDAFPIQIYRRYKSDQSLKDKMNEWSTREEKQGKQVTDYLGFKIIPEAEHQIFFAGGDKELQRMIEKSEKIRTFVSSMYQSLSDETTLTFENYTKKCIDILRQLYRCFPKEASERRKFYQNKSKQIKRDFDSYSTMFEDPNVPMSLEEISKLTDVNIKQLLSELSKIYANEVYLYKLRSDLMNTFSNSELLKFLRNICII